MDVLSAAQLRVLGVLVEKEATTPDQYPLTLNALLLGINQTSNRNPVLSWGGAEIGPVMADLRSAGLARVVHSPSNRAEKYRHVLGEAWGLGSGELAVLAVLALRGPQTANELTARTERYHGLEEMGGVEGILHRLKNRYDAPYVTRLERQPGQREERWAHLLAGEVLDVAEPDPARGPAARGGATPDRLAALESRMAGLDAEVADLRRQLEAFRDQFA